MVKRIVFWFIFVVFYILFFKILQFIWDEFVPFNSLTNIISLFILVVVNIPLSVISTQKLIEVIKRE